MTGQDKKAIHIADPDPSVKLTKLSRDLRKNGQESVFMAPSPDSKPHKEEKQDPILLANLAQTAGFDC